jgi:hypothetical protein
VCNYPCNTKDELAAKEAEYIKQYRNDDMYECVNMCIPGRTNKQYSQDNKEKIAEYQKQYRQTEKHKDIRKVSHICGCGSKYTIEHKARHFKTKKHMKWEATK